MTENVLESYAFIALTRHNKVTREQLGHFGFVFNIRILLIVD
jgi:hypothetical protein